MSFHRAVLLYHIVDKRNLTFFLYACALDRWSRGKTVRLEADLDLAGMEFTPIPTFGGTFEGQGHTISGLSITGSGNVRGLFRYIQPTGAVRDLTVEGSLNPSDRKNTLGGLTGENRGVLTNCAFSGSVTGEHYVGAVAGDVDSGGTVSGNTFTSESLGALDGISYAGKAEPVDFDVLCSTEGVPERFSRLELTFVADGVTVAVVPFQYGEGIDSLPEIPARKGYSAAWPDLDYTHLTASRTLEAVYTPYTSALTGGGALPEILVDGSFSPGAEVSHTTEDVTWTDDRGQTHSGTAYTVTVDDPELEQVSYTVHFRLPESGKRDTLWVKGEAGWSRRDCETDGQYLLLRSESDTVTFCVTERPAGFGLQIAAGAGCLLLAAGFCIMRRLRTERRRAREDHET